MKTGGPVTRMKPLECMDEKAS
jgi:hypothetical protein